AIASLPTPVSAREGRVDGGEAGGFTDGRSCVGGFADGRSCVGGFTGGRSCVGGFTGGVSESWP
ncbi:hypothetical protein, partial [Streptomyces ipomoeae]|uniref:hypothetical protein n=1 Tax=Streptomyces ipomoeae TaxID=103232 RepID=UPI003986DA4F